MRNKKGPSGLGHVMNNEEDEKGSSEFGEVHQKKDQVGLGDAIKRTKWNPESRDGEKRIK